MQTDYFSKISYIELETNSSCNLDCKFCNRSYLSSLGLREPKNITQKEFIYILDQFKECRIDTIKIEGLSEPMLHPEFDKLSELVRNQFPKAFVIIATNCQYNLLDTPFLSTLPFVDMVYLSIDGTHGLYENIRKNASYSKLISSLDDIKANVPEKVRRQKLHINFTLTKENYLSLPEMYDLKNRYNLASVRINLAQNWNEDQLNPNIFDDEIISFLKEYKNDLKGVPDWKYHECFWPFNGLTVDVFGNARQCIINTSQKPLINIFESNIHEFFNQSEYYKGVREGLSADSPPPSCQNCDYNFLAPTLKKILEVRDSGHTPRKINK